VSGAGGLGWVVFAGGAGRVGWGAVWWGLGFPVVGRAVGLREGSEVVA